MGKDLIVIESDALSIRSKENGYDKYVKYLYSLNKEQFVSYENFFLSQPFSRRTINCIRDIGFRHFYVNYLFASGAKILSLRKFGKKSYFEMEKTRQNLIDYVIKSSQISSIGKTHEADDSKGGIIETGINEVKEPKALTLRETVGEAKFQLIEAKFHETLKRSGLSVRASNGIKSYKGDFIEDFIHRQGDVKALRMIGKKTEIEIKSFIKNLRLYIDDITESDVSKEEQKLLLLKAKYGGLMDEYACNVYSERKQLPMFYIIEGILRQEEEDSNMILFLSRHLPMSKGETRLSLEQIAKKYSLSRERVRQLCTKGIDYLYGVAEPQITDKMNYEKIISFQEDWYYIKDMLKHEDVIKKRTIENILQQEDCNLTISFCMVILFRVFNGEYSMVGNKPYDINTRSKSLWNSSFLVKTELVEAFNFDDMHHVVDRYFEEHDTEEFTCLTADDLLMDFFVSSWNEFDSSKAEAVTNVISEMLMQEFGLIPDEEFRFLIQGQKKLSAADVLFKALNEKQEPMTIEELFAILQTKHSFKYKSSASIKGIVNSDVRLCMVGVNNLVALPEWEHIKIGSVRDIIVQYLEQFNEPKTVQEIVGYVLQYRNTTENSVRSTMYSGSQFRQFANGCFGLADKTYAYEHLYEQSQDFKLRIQELENFLKDNGHFPFSSSEEHSEVNLRQWWHRNKNSESLNYAQQNEIRRIQDTYWYLPADKRELGWFSIFNQYREFVQKHDRRPSCYVNSEKSLAEWFSNAQKEFIEGELSENEEKVYLRLCKIL